MDSAWQTHEAEEAFAKDGTLPNPDSASNEEEAIILGVIRDELGNDPQRWHKVARSIIGVSEETTTGVLRLNQRAKAGTLLSAGWM